MTGRFDKRYLQFFSLFRQEKFFEAHEVLESLWRERQGEEREFYHGLIQLAAALVHYQKGNLKGAKELYRTASGYLERYRPVYQGVSVARVLKDFERFLQVWSESPDEPSLAREELPRLEFKRGR